LIENQYQGGISHTLMQPLPQTQPMQLPVGWLKI
jgi:hypothetical protein